MTRTIIIKSPRITLKLSYTVAIKITTSGRERRRLWCPEAQSWIQKRHNDVFPDEPWFLVQYPDGRTRVWNLRGDCPSLDSIRYHHKGHWDIRLLPQPSWFPDLSPIENIWSWIAEKLIRHLSPTYTVHEEGHRLEAV
ncbi:hypothetical protein TNCV_1872621 [Trichonephila clavipes]|nr:hypothetical protein TNCV_1872621 [Trichonephila clavipes]